MNWTLIILYVSTVHSNGYPTLGVQPPYVTVTTSTHATRADAEAELVKRETARQKSLAMPYAVQSIPAIAGPYTTSDWQGDALLVSADGKVEKVRALMGTRKVRKEIEVEEETGWRVEVLP